MMSNLSTLPKEKSQTGWRHVHPWWTRRWFGLHWSSEVDSESIVIFWGKPKKLTPSFVASSIFSFAAKSITPLWAYLLASHEALHSSVKSCLHSSVKRCLLALLRAHSLDSLEALHSSVQSSISTSYEAFFVAPLMGLALFLVPHEALFLALLWVSSAVSLYGHFWPFKSQHEINVIDVTYLAVVRCDQITP